MTWQEQENDQFTTKECYVRSAVCPSERVISRHRGSYLIREDDISSQRVISWVKIHILNQDSWQMNSLLVAVCLSDFSTPVPPDFSFSGWWGCHMRQRMTQRNPIESSRVRMSQETTGHSLCLSVSLSTQHTSQCSWDDFCSRLSPETTGQPLCFSAGFWGSVTSQHQLLAMLMSVSMTAECHQRQQSITCAVRVLHHCFSDSNTVCKVGKDVKHHS